MTYPIKPAEPLDPSITSIQRGRRCDGSRTRLGKLRRWYLKTFRKGYVEEMAQLRRGTENKAPHEVLDPRDVKYYRNLGGYHWTQRMTRLRGGTRSRLPRPGLAELIIYSFLSFGWAAVGAWGLQRFDLPLWASIPGWLLVATFAVIGLLIVWFFRNPQRRILRETIWWSPPPMESWSRSTASSMTTTSAARQ